MLEDPPLLTIRRQFSRPAAAVLTSFDQIPSVFFVDAQGGRGGLDYRIKPWCFTGPTPTFVGAALTCHCGPADNLALFAAVALAEPGDVLVVATDEFTQTSLTGDLLLRMASNQGVRALVTDGLVRDCAGIRDVGIPVFCRGLTPNSPVRHGPGSVGLPISLGGVTVHPGDVVVADEDGVVIVPQDDIQPMLSRVSAIQSAEAEFEQTVRDGLAVPEFISTLLQSDRVRYLDEAD